MAWKPPRTWAEGQTITGKDWNDHIRGQIELHERMKALEASPSVAGSVMVAGLLVAGSSRKVDRRSLLGLGRFRKTDV